MICEPGSSGAIHCNKQHLYHFWLPLILICYFVTELSKWTAHLSCLHSRQHWDFVVWPWQLSTVLCKIAGLDGFRITIMNDVFALHFISLHLLNFFFYSFVLHSSWLVMSHGAGSYRPKLPRPACTETETETDTSCLFISLASFLATRFKYVSFVKLLNLRWW